MKRALILLASTALLVGCRGEPPVVPPTEVFEAVCNGRATRFSAHGLAWNDDASEPHQAYVTEQFWDGVFWQTQRRNIARFAPSCSVVRVQS